MTRMLVQQTPAVETAPLRDDSILFHPGLNRFCILNRTSSLIWHKMQVPVTPEQIAAELSSSFSDTTPDDVLRDVHAAIDKLRELELVVTRPSD